MTSLILKLFVYNKERTDAALRLRLGTLGGIVGIIVNLLLAGTKALAGWLFGSIALVADAANNLTDAASSIITLFGFKLAARKPDRDHPYGHGRMEYLSGMMMAFLVLMLGFSLLKGSVSQILHPESLVFSYLSVAIMVLGIVGKLWLSLFFKKLQKLTGSATFGAASADSRNDVLSTLAVLCSTVIFAVTNINLDGYIGLLVSLFILYSAVGLIKETLDPLLGQPPEKEFVGRIYQKAMSYEGILGIHDLVVHNYGPGRTFISFHAEVSAHEDMLTSHDLVDNIERDFWQDMGIETVIHIDPVILNDPKLIELESVVRRTLLEIDAELTMHDFRVVMGPTHTNLIFDVVLPAGFKKDKAQLKAEFDTLLHRTHPECFTVITFDNSYI